MRTQRLSHMPMHCLVEPVYFEGDYNDYARRYGYILREMQDYGRWNWKRRAIRIFFVSAMLGRWRRWRDRCRWRGNLLIG